MDRIFIDTNVAGRGLTVADIERDPDRYHTTRHNMEEMLAAGKHLTDSPNAHAKMLKERRDIGNYFAANPSRVVDPRPNKEIAELAQLTPKSVAARVWQEHHGTAIPTMNEYGFWIQKAEEALYTAFRQPRLSEVSQPIKTTIRRSMRKHILHQSKQNRAVGNNSLAGDIALVTAAVGRSAHHFTAVATGDSDVENMIDYCNARFDTDIPVIKNSASRNYF